MSYGTSTGTIGSVKQDGDREIRWTAWVEIDWTYEAPSRVCPGGGSLEVRDLNECEIEVVTPTRTILFYVYVLDQLADLLAIWNIDIDDEVQNWDPTP